MSNPLNPAQVVEGPPATAKTTPAPPLLVNAKRAAELLGISRSHFCELHQMQQVPAPVRLGRSVRWNVAELRAWIAAGCPNLERWKLIRMNGKK